MNENRKGGLILDARGKPIGTEEFRLSPAIEALVRVRIEEAVAQTREVLGSEQRQQNQGLRWRAASFAAGLAIATGAIGWAINVSPADVRRLINERLADTELRATIAGVTAEYAEPFVSAQLQPLKQDADHLANRFEALATFIDEKQFALAAEQGRLAQTLLYQRWSLEAKNGALLSYVSLKEAISGEPQEVGAAQLFLRDVEDYFESFRFQTFRRRSVDPHTGRAHILVLEEALSALRHSSASVREIAANELESWGSMEAVGALVEVVRSEQHLVARAAMIRAVNEIANQRFSVLDDNALVAWWSAPQNLGRYAFPYESFVEVSQEIGRIARLGTEPLSVSDSRSLEEGIRFCSKVLTNPSTRAYRTRLDLIVALCVAGRVEEAAQHSGRLHAESWLFPFAEAVVAAARSDHAKVPSLLNVCLERVHPYGRPPDVRLLEPYWQEASVAASRKNEAGAGTVKH